MAEPAKQPEKMIQAIIEASNEMSPSLYAAIHEKSDNFIFSTLSTHLGLAMLSAGAEGSTAKEMDVFLKLPVEAQDKKKLAKSYLKLFEKYVQAAGSDGFELHMANGLFVESLRMGVGETGVKRSFSEIIEEDYGSSVMEVLFELDTLAADIINTWVSRNVWDTYRSRKLIDPREINKDTVLLLFSAGYFKGKWKVPFDQSNTTRHDFYLDSHDNKEVDMMHVKGKFPYCIWKELDAHALAIPYKDTEGLYLMIYIPIKRPMEGTGKGLALLETKLMDLTPESVFDGMESTLARVSLPRFHVESKIALEEFVRKAGVKLLFDAKKAELTGIVNFTVPEDRIFLSDMIQTAWIEVSEAGTNIPPPGSHHEEIHEAPPQHVRSRPVPVTFAADHPFIFQIVDTEKNLVLFTGRCVNPTTSQPVAEDSWNHYEGEAGDGDKLSRQFIEKLTI